MGHLLLVYIFLGNLVYVLRWAVVKCLGKQMLGFCSSTKLEQVQSLFVIESVRT